MSCLKALKAPPVLLCCMAGAHRLAGDELLPEVCVHLEAALYAPTEPDLIWAGWIRATGGVLRAQGVTI